MTKQEQVKMKSTLWCINEWCYSCPYCELQQGWSDYTENKVTTCDECDKEFLVLKR